MRIEAKITEALCSLTYLYAKKINDKGIIFMTYNSEGRTVSELKKIMKFLSILKKQVKTEQF